jgi:hypothetical protein
MIKLKIIFAIGPYFCNTCFIGVLYYNQQNEVNINQT